MCVCACVCVCGVCVCVCVCVCVFVCFFVRLQVLGNWEYTFPESLCQDIKTGKECASKLPFANTCCDAAFAARKPSIPARTLGWERDVERRVYLIT